MGHQTGVTGFQTGDGIPDEGGVQDMVMMVFQTGDGVQNAGKVPNMG